LERISGMQDRLGRLSRQIAELEHERQTIHQEQGRIRENLQALGDRSSEKEFRERLVRTLNEQEDRLNAISSGLQAARQESATLTEERNILIAQLDEE